jgi:nucleotide-binding universal stress UspA family protein
LECHKEAAVKILVWLTEGTWEACVDAARDLLDGQVTLLHIIDPAIAEALAVPPTALLGRGKPLAAHDTLADAQHALLDAAAARLGRPTARLGRRGRPEREVVAASADTDILVLARDGDHTSLGPRSLGHATRFVVDHAPCQVLLVWPDQPPDLATIPPPPHPPAKRTHPPH